MRRRIPIVYKKLKTKWGWCKDKHLELDIRLKGKKHLEILIHECLHHVFYEKSEEEIEKKAIILTNTLWHEGYRRPDNDTSQPLQDGLT